MVWVVCVVCAVPSPLGHHVVSSDVDFWVRMFQNVELSSIHGLGCFRIRNYRRLMGTDASKCAIVVDKWGSKVLNCGIVVDLRGHLKCGIVVDLWARMFQKVELWSIYGLGSLKVWCCRGFIGFCDSIVGSMEHLCPTFCFQYE